MLNLALKSCNEDFKASVVDPSNTTCSDDALEKFCCFVPTDIDQYQAPL